MPFFKPAFKPDFGSESIINSPIESSHYNFINQDTFTGFDDDSHRIITSIVPQQPGSVLHVRTIPGKLYHNKGKLNFYQIVYDVTKLNSFQR